MHFSTIDSSKMNRYAAYIFIDSYTCITIFHVAVFKDAYIRESAVSLIQHQFSAPVVVSTRVVVSWFFFCSRALANHVTTSLLHRYTCTNSEFNDYRLSLSLSLSLRVVVTRAYKRDFASKV